MRLNQYIGRTGYCTRREATRYILRGEVKVNGEVETNDAYKMQEGDEVTHLDKPIFEPVKYTYLLMNKPRHFTTVKSEDNPKYLLGLIKKIENDKLQVVDNMGPTDLGLVLITDDTAILEKLRDDKRSIKSVYAVTLENDITDTQLEKLKALDGIKAASIVDTNDPKHIGVEMSLGNPELLQNQLSSLDIKSVRIDRNYYAGLNKKDLKRGWYRPLSLMEERMVKHFL